MDTKNHEKSIHDWLRLLRAPGIGSKTINRLLEHFTDITNIFSADRSSLQAAGLSNKQLSALKTVNEERLDKDIAWLRQAGNALITIDSPDYPQQLSRTSNPPPALFITGNPDLLHLPQLAIVGARNPTPPGRQNAEDFAFFLARNGFCITSGMALGIDTCAHRGALRANGHTIAVTGTGLDRVYPAENKDLAHQIANTGLLVSEFPPGTSARPGHFPSRNRIIAGLGSGTLIVEAAVKSGSLITARLALEADREVFAIPGSIHNPLARGCHLLIRQGAKLVETADDIVEELASLLALDNPAQAIEPSTSQQSGAEPVLDTEYTRLLEEMGYDAINVDQLITRTRQTAGEISSMLLLLELQGYVSSVPGGQFVRTKCRTHNDAHPA